jgi:Na+/H+ antiporter NhaC
MVAVISRNGGMAGVVNSLSRYANTPRSSQFITWLLGVAIFFDDYANTLIVGNTMRSVTDSFRISREKLAYIVDSTAAPVAAVAFITTWIGAELGFIESGLTKLNTFDMEISAYSLFLSSLKYSFYPVMTLAFILMLIYTQRDYGPMYKAETRARTTGRVSAALSEDEDEPNMEDLSPVKGAPKRWQHAVFPVLTVIIMTILGLVATGMNTTYDDLVATGARLPNAGWGTIWAAMPALWEGESPGFFLKLGKLIGNADSYTALLWASLSGATLAVIITLGARIMRLMDTMHSLLTGFKAMLPAVIILTLAWSLAITTDELYTADFITTALAGNLSPYLIPPLVFILAALISFSTGSSWSTMTILYPIAIPTAWILSTEAGLDPEVSMEILLNVIAVVLAASVLGDHCSPISDTTILSSLASDCNHIDHVRTQMPYALTVGSVSLIACWLSTFLGGGWLISTLILLLGLVLLYFIVLKWGRKNVDYVKEEA